MDVVDGIRRFVPDELAARYAGAIREFYGPKARELGWLPKPSDNADTRLLRPRLLRFVAAEGEDPALAAEAGKLARQWLTDRESVPADIAGAVLDVAAWHASEANGGNAFYEALVADAARAKSRRDRDLILHAIGNFRDPSIARRALGLMLGEQLETRELTDLLTAFAGHSATRRLPWEFVVTNYDKVLPRLPTRLGTHGGSILPTAGRGFCDASGYASVESFFRDRIKPIEGGARVLANVLEAIDLCAARSKSQGPEVAAWLRSRSE